ncbi:unnamed protein product, partial [Prorocentrum cordatum]
EHIHVHLPAWWMPGVLGAKEQQEGGFRREVRRRQPDADQAKKEQGLKEVKALKHGEKTMLGLMSRQTLRSAQQLRELQAVIYDVRLLAETCSIVLATQEQTSNYADHVKGKKDHDLGPPHIYSLGGALKTYADVKPGTPGFSMPEPLHKELNTAFAEYDKWPMEQKCDLVLHCRVEKVFQRGMRKVTVAFRDPQFRIMMNKAFECAEGAEKKVGKAPPTFLERDLQEWLEGMES